MMIRTVIGNKFIAIAIVVAIAFIVLLAHLLYIPVERNNFDPVEVIVVKGDGLSSVAYKLKGSGLVKSNLMFRGYVWLMGSENDLKAGKYVLSKSMNTRTIAYLITGGASESNDIIVTIPEGVNIWEIDERLIDLGLILEGEFSAQFKDDEGYLFPDTYRITKVESNGVVEMSSILEELRDKMSQNFNFKTSELLSGLSLAESREVIIVASILEKEARREEDMKLVAGIVYKRLDLGMPLQVDAAVIYGACRRKAGENNFVKNCNVTWQGPAIEIKIDGPFNTYIRKGLPLAPISNPGLNAIRAALNSQKSDYLYYLSTRDGSQMIYSKTPAEHVANRRKYLGI